jgi:hypothetical protein
VPRTRLSIVLGGAAALAVGCVGMATAAVAAPSGTTWYVSATASGAGTGMAADPFNSLEAAQAASSPGDTIVVDPAPLSVPPLDGGITLKPGQHLIGGGATILRRGVTDPRLTSLPRISNTTNTANNGDAVDLANNTTVSNLVIAGSYRGGIYGNDVTGTAVSGNDVSGQNTSGTVGFLVLPFAIERYTALPPGTPAQPPSTTSTLNNGWGGIMIDESTANGSVTIDGNYVHDGVCGDGIDLRGMDTANITAQINNNLITRLIQCSLVRSLLNIGTQANNDSIVTVHLNGNTEINSGSAGADTEGMFANIGGSGHLTDTIDHNTYANGIGGRSTNGIEFIMGFGEHEVGEVNISNSTYANNPGDMLEEFNRGTDSYASMTLNHVVVNGTTITGGLPPYAYPPGTATTPDNTGECYGMGSVGSSDVTTFTMNNSVFENCDNNGIEVTNNNVPMAGVTNQQQVALDIENSKVVGVRDYGLWFDGVMPLNDLKVKVQGSEIANSSGILVGFDQQPTGYTANSAIDLGGGSLGSAGRNCVFGGATLDLESQSFNVSAQHDWFGTAGDVSDLVSASPEGYLINTAHPLRKAPPACKG